MKIYLKAAAAALFLLSTAAYAQKYTGVIDKTVATVGNEVITLVKDTSLAFTIAVTEMFTIAKQLSSANTSMTPLVAAGVFYYLFNYAVAWTMERIEKHFAYYD